MRIYVGNLSYTTTEERLREVFTEYGQVDEVVIPTDRDSGRSRGFGFITMPDSEQSQAAIRALDGADLDGRTLRVNEARPRREFGGGNRRDRW